MPAKYPIRFLFALLLSAHIGSASAAGPEADRCLADLEAIAAFMPVNDAGGADHLADHGGAIEAALRKARGEAGALADAASCETVLQTYLRAWRVGHLRVAPAVAGAGVAGTTARPELKGSADPRAPRLELLGKDTLLLVLPTFDDRYAAALKALLAEQRAALESHKYWIVDVRANGGGSDSTYAPLLPWLLDGDYPAHSVEYLVTPANIRAQEGICALTSDPASCAETMDPIVRKMRAAAPGSRVLMGEERMRIERAPAREPQAPARVAVLVDRKCGSSCEQFLLSVRGSFKVKLVGRSSFGSLDMSNMRGHALPSGRMLYYATTRSTRLPDMRIDGVGIAPDLLLPKPADEAGRAAEVKQVQRWIETGALR